MNPVAYYGWVENTDTATLAVVVMTIFAFAIVCIILWRKVHEADMVKHDFVSMVTHKLRTPLTAAKWASETLRSTEKDPVKLELIDAIDTAHNRLNGLIISLIDLANADHSGAHTHFVPTSLIDLIRKVADQMKSIYLEKGIVFTVQYPEKDVLVFVDNEQISFVLQTLLENAHHYTNVNGRVTLSVVYDKHYATISVMDTGIGMTPADIAHICSKSYRSDSAKQSDPDGFGIGLYLSKKILKRHHGDIVVSSQGLGMGSTFVVRIPIKK